MKSTRLSLIATLLLMALLMVIAPLIAQGPNAGGEFNRLAGVPPSTLAFAFVESGELKDVWGGARDAQGQGTEVVQTGDFDFPGVDGVEDARHEACAHAVA